MQQKKREKLFGKGISVPGDRNMKIRIKFFARVVNAKHRQPGEHIGPLKRSYLEILDVLLWVFHNQHTGLCFPSYEALAAKSGYDRSTVIKAVKALEQFGILTWCHRLVRVGNQVLRTSNSYRFLMMSRPNSPEWENPAGTEYQVNQRLTYLRPNNSRRTPSMRSLSLWEQVDAINVKGRSV